MQTYRHLGKEAMIACAKPTELKRYGQPFDMPEDHVPAALNASVAFLPTAEFDKIGFSEKDLATHFMPNLFHRAPADFKEKVAAAHVAYLAFRESVLNPPAPAEADGQKVEQV